MKIKFAEEDNHAARSLRYASNWVGMFSVVHWSAALDSCTFYYEISDYLDIKSQQKIVLSVTDFSLCSCIVFFLDCFKIWNLKMNWSRKGQPRSSHWLELTYFILCVLASGKLGKGKKKQASVTPDDVTVTVPGHRGQWDKSGCSSQNRARASIRTGRRLCENKLRSLWSAELFLLCHRTSRSGRPFIHSIACQQVSWHT